MTPGPLSVGVAHRDAVVGIDLEADVERRTHAKVDVASLKLPPIAEKDPLTSVSSSLSVELTTVPFTDKVDKRMQAPAGRMKSRWEHRGLRSGTPASGALPPAFQRV